MARQQPLTIDQPSCFRSGTSEEVSTTIARGRILTAGTGADGVLRAAAASDLLVGVAVEDMAPGTHQSYQSDGLAAVELGGTLAAGAAVTTDSVGRAVAASVSAGTVVNLLGRIVQGGDSGDLGTVELFKAQQSFIGATSVADRTALKAIVAAERFNGQLVLVRSDDSLWTFDSSSTASDASEQLVATPGAGTGRWIRADKSFTMKLPIGFATADAAVLHTVPAGFVLKLTAHPFWEITAAFTGGTDSSIGLSSSRTGYSTKGDLIAATLAAALTAGIRVGTIGDKLDSLAEFHALVLEAAQTIRHDRIVDAFTAGAGFVCVPVTVLQTA